MGITDVLTEICTIKRLTPDLIEDQALDSATITNQPIEASRLEVTISGATITTGLLTISGNVSEAFSFSDNDILIGEEDFTSLSGFEYSGIEGGRILVRAITRMGEQINQEVVITEDLPCRTFSMRGRVFNLPQGDENPTKHGFMAGPDANFEENDLFYSESGIKGLTKGFISFIETIRNFDGATQHYECEVKPI